MPGHTHHIRSTSPYSDTRFWVEVRTQDSWVEDWNELNFQKSSTFKLQIGKLVYRIIHTKEMKKYANLITLIKRQGHRLTSKFQISYSYSTLYLGHYSADLAEVLGKDLCRAGHNCKRN